MNEEIRTRFAPSPTGLFHLGNARAALFNYLYAKKYDGKFILRIEDSDRERSKEEYELDIKEGLSWLGLGWDEGPDTPDNLGPYRQSERGEIYKKYIEKLINNKKAYYCFCTQEELEKERKEQEAKHVAPKYSGKCRDLSDEQIEKLKTEGKKPAIRFRVEDSPTGGSKIKFKDLVHGEIEFDTKLIGDFIIVKPSGDPIFLLSNIIDDAEMKISHVIRGEDHLSNTPKQIMIANALDLPIPEYAHLPMILNPDRTKLSKRKNPVSVTYNYKDEGYLPEAMINFMAFLGWTPGADDDDNAQEYFTLDELIDEFDLKNVGKSPAIFDEKKLEFLNGYYIRKMPLGDLAKNCLPYMEKAGLVKKENEGLLKAINLVQERMKKLSEAPILTKFLFEKPKYNTELLIPKKGDKEQTKKALEDAYKVLQEENDFSVDSIEQLLRALGKKLNIPAGNILWPVRVALSGEPASPGAFELIEYFGKDETLARIKTAIDMLQ
jgi:glutamyl-tRNA synthetase